VESKLSYKKRCIATMTTDRKFHDRESNQKAAELSCAQGNAKEIDKELGIRPE
jgi:hypothetical protein